MKLLFGTALATVAFATAANAAITLSLTNGVYTPFDEFVVGTQSGTTTTENGATTFSVTSGSFVTNTSVGSQYLKPLNDGPNGSLSNYIFATSGSANVAGPSNVKIGYAHDVYGFKILWGSPDTYNTITLNNGDSITGSALLTLTSTPSGSNAGTRWVYVHDDLAFQSWTASSSGVAFEFDLNAPEPSTWAMMGLGFLGLAYVGYRRNSKSRPAAA